jgi:hypothetical protein
MNTKPCRECGKGKVLARGLCSRCYQDWRARQKGIPERGPKRWAGIKVCLECGGKAWNRGLCRKCYARWWRRNSERARVIEERRQAKLRFGAHADIAARIESGCERCGMANDEHKKRFGGRLHVHHVDHNGIESGHPNHDVGNLRVLCGRCHRAVHVEERKAVTV